MSDKLTPEEMIKVMQAYINGEEIQFRRSASNGSWQIASAPVWNWSDYSYRAKPTPQYRPFKAFEAVNLLGDEVRNNCSGTKYVIVQIVVTSEFTQVYLGPKCGPIASSEELLKHYQFSPSGTPCGVLVDENL